MNIMMQGSKRFAVRTCAVLVAGLLSGGAPGVAAAVGAESNAGVGFVLVGEMEPLEGIFTQPRRVREALKGHVEAERGLEQLKAWVRAEWPRIREVDFTALSRFHIEQTRGFELPVDPGELTGRAIAHDEATGRWSLELRGPRLPARYDIVHRYLHVYASFHPATGQLSQLLVTIRGWVLE